MERRDFLKLSAVATMLGPLAWDAVAETVSASEIPDLVAVRKGSIKTMFEAGIKAIGGLPVKGKKVLVKPNIGWNKAPEFAADTNPELIGLIVTAAIKAGAKEVVVFDHTCDKPAVKCYKKSGIKEAVEKAGGKMIDGNKKSNYAKKVNSKAKILKKTQLHKYVSECDYFINVPILKTHGGATMSCAMKNLMGIVYDRRYFHREGLHQCIADSVLYRKPDLNIVDAYNVMYRNGPRGRSAKDVQQMKFQLFSKDIVAVDVVAAKLLKLDIAKIGHIAMGAKLKLGNDDLKKVKIKKISLKA